MVLLCQQKKIQGTHKEIISRHPLRLTVSARTVSIDTLCQQEPSLPTQSSPMALLCQQKISKVPLKKSSQGIPLDLLCQQEPSLPTHYRHIVSARTVPIDTYVSKNRPYRHNYGFYN